MTLCGSILVISYNLLIAAVLSGKGALAMAINSTQNFFWLFLDIVINLKVPKVYEFGAMVIGIIGATMIALAHSK